MPIVLVGYRPVLVCANREHGSHLVAEKESTMQALPGWRVLLSVDPPTGGMPANVQASSIVPVKLYACGVCGYIELYAAAVTEPETWRVGK